LLKNSEFGVGADSSGVLIPRVGRLSRLTVRSAMEVLRPRHGIADSETAFDVLRTASQQHNVKLRAVAAAVVESADADDEPRCVKPSAPPAPAFSARAGAATPCRTAVLRDLMYVAIADAGADYGNVQLRDPVHGGLTIECHSGFNRDFIDFFGYVDDAGSACGATLTEARQVIVDDVETAPVFAEPERALVLGSGVRSVVSTPLLDEHGTVRGVVSTHYNQPHRTPDAGVVRRLQLRAGAGARWLSWYDCAVMPRVLAAVRAAAHAAAKGPAAPNPAVAGGH
jgi:hypothetical protein